MSNLGISTGSLTNSGSSISSSGINYPGKPVSTVRSGAGTRIKKSNKFVVLAPMLICLVAAQIMTISGGLIETSG